MSSANHHPVASHLLIVGSGASAIYLLRHILTQIDALSPHLRKISIFERDDVPGMGMPYNPRTTDRHNLSNISSDELPDLIVSFADWLRELDAEEQAELDLTGVEISESEVYSRLALGRYLQSQYQIIADRIRAGGIELIEHPGCEVIDIQENSDAGQVTLIAADGQRFGGDTVVIATGHSWAESDDPDHGYYASPWPIAKLLPADGEHLDFVVGTLGASLSAFDVATSLSHRHGTFREVDGTLTYLPDPGTEKFGLALHSAQGLLPHLQYDLAEPFREIYRHVDRKNLFALVDADGFLRIDTYFDKICRPALIEAFEKDESPELVGLLGRSEFGLEEFVEKMTSTHAHDDAFAGMSHEMKEAVDSVIHHHPIHWKEVIDDLIYTLNYHAELMPAEDHLTLRKTVMPFLMNVIAALPLQSGRILLALHAAGKLELIPGRVERPAHQPEARSTVVEIENDGETTERSYRMFVACGGQKPMELDEYPFPTLVKSGAVRRARALFAAPDQALDNDIPEDRLISDEGPPALATGGIDIDGAFRVIGRTGEPNPRIYDIAFPHTSGVRPYSYGLPACSATSAILVETWVDALSEHHDVDGELEDVAEIYETIEEGSGPSAPADSAA